MDKKYCEQCGAENKIDSNFCESCGKELKQFNNVENNNNPTIQATNNNVPTNNVVNNTNNNSDDKKGNELGYISLILYFAGGLLTRVFYSLSTTMGNSNVLIGLFGLMPLAGIVLMIYGRIKYPKNKVLKTAMIIMIIMIVLAIIYFIIIAMLMVILCGSCLDTISNMD